MTWKDRINVKKKKKFMMKDNIISPKEMNTIRINLDILKYWIFTYKGKTFNLNVKELLKLLKEFELKEEFKQKIK